MTAHEAAFDPYLKWLGIRTKDQPPDHYRLLGLELFESDADVIATAADARMLHVKTFQTGRHAALSQRLLNEIAAAKVCLLNPERKAEYDRMLREKLAAEEAAALPPEPPPKPLPPALPVSTSPGGRAGGIPFGWKVAALGTVAVALLTAIVLLLVGNRGDDPSVALGHGEPEPSGPAVAPPEPPQPPKVDPAKTTASSDPSGATPSGTPGKPEPPKPDPVGLPPKSLPGKEDGKEPPKEPAEVSKPAPDPFAPDEPEKKTKPGEKMDPGEEEPGEEPAPKTVRPRPRPKPTVEEPAAPVKRLPAPAEDVQKSAEKEIRSTLSGDFGRAKNAEQRRLLAEKLFSLGVREQDPATRYTLLWMGCETAVAGGDLAHAFDGIDEIGKAYEIDPLATKIELLTRMAETTRVLPGLPASALEWAEAVLAVTDEALLAGKPESAQEGIKLIGLVGRRAKAPELAAAAIGRGKLLEQARQELDAFQKAAQALNNEPDNASALFTVGRWRCFVEGQWKQGLALLAKCGNPGLEAIAQQELAGPTDPNEQYALAEAWMKQADDDAAFKPQMMARAAFWLRRAKDDLRADRVPRIDRLLAQVSPFLPLTRNGAGAVRPGVNVALAANGARATSTAGTIAGINDGVIPMVLQQSGIAYATTRDCEWVITLDQVYRLREIRVKFPEGKGSFHSYSLQTSLDGVKFHHLTGPQQGAGWQQIRFLPRPAKVIKLIGHAHTLGSTYYVSELEAYTATPIAGP